MSALLELTDVRVRVHDDRHRESAATSLIERVSFAVDEGELVCVVGESGSGKSVTGQAILGLAAESGLRVDGSIRFAGDELVGRTPAQLRALRGRRFALVPQEPVSALDPLFTIGAQMREAVERRDGRTRNTRARVQELLELAQVPDAAHRMRQYPSELSGGLCQRVLVAMALAARPELIVADEPTSALDATVQLQLLDLLDRVRAQTRAGMVLITHDMSVAARADRIVVMYAGTVVEEGSAERVLHNPEHPYTAGLIASVPPLDELTRTRASGRMLPVMAGSVPSPSMRTPGCGFRDRCPLATEDCAQPQPLGPVESAVPAHVSACGRVLRGEIDMATHPVWRAERTAS